MSEEGEGRDLALVLTPESFSVRFSFLTGAIDFLPVVVFDAALFFIACTVQCLCLVQEARAKTQHSEYQTVQLFYSLLTVQTFVDKHLFPSANVAQKQPWTDLSLQAAEQFLFGQHKCFTFWHSKTSSTPQVESFTEFQWGL